MEKRNIFVMPFLDPHGCPAATADSFLLPPALSLYLLPASRRAMQGEGALSPGIRPRHNYNFK